jgi:hypothetical protein
MEMRIRFHSLIFSPFSYRNNKKTFHIIILDAIVEKLQKSLGMSSDFCRAGGTRTHTHSRVEDFKFIWFVSIPYNWVYSVYIFYIWGVKVSTVSIRSMLIAH